MLHLISFQIFPPNAPKSPEDSAKDALAIVTLPFEITGKFFKDGKEINF